MQEILTSFPFWLNILDHTHKYFENILTNTSTLQYSKNTYLQERLVQIQPKKYHTTMQHSPLATNSERTLLAF